MKKIYDGLKNLFRDKRNNMDNLTNLSCWDIDGFEGENVWDEYQFELDKQNILMR